MELTLEQMRDNWNAAIAATEQKEKAMRDEMAVLAMTLDRANTSLAAAKNKIKQKDSELKAAQNKINALANRLEYAATAFMVIETLTAKKNGGAGQKVRLCAQDALRVIRS